MSGMSDVFQGIKDTLINSTNGVDPGKPINVQIGIPDAVNDYPAALVRPNEPIDLMVAINGNTFQGTMRITILIRSADDAEGWKQLWDYIDPVAATKSVVRALRADRTLNSFVDDSQVRLIEGISKRAEGVFGFDVLLDYIKTVA